ncbi:MAG TPA: DUF1572 family protein [Gemmataceae bacterium]|nr:DUF1572 family protein [Gemmataceae bacterium]
MQPDSNELAAAVTAEAAHELASALARVRHCLDQLTDEQVWWRPSESMNSAANLVLHLCGNLRQWVIAGLGGTPDHRDRPREFAERGPIPKAELLRRLEQTVEEARQALGRQTPADLLRVRRIQGFDVTGLRAIFDAVPHFRGHTQEIVHLTRTLKGDAYRFAFVPVGVEQGAPA